MKKLAAVLICFVAALAQTANAQGPGTSFPSGAVNVLAYGAQADAQTSGKSLCSIAQGSTSLTCTIGIFTPADTGKWIEVPAAGGVLGTPATLLAQISTVVVSSGVDTTYGKFKDATLSLSAANAVMQPPGVAVTWGTDNSVPFQNAVNACPASSNGNPSNNSGVNNANPIFPFTSKGCVIVVPNPGMAGTGDYMFGSSTSGVAVSMPSQVSFQMIGMGNSSKWENSQEAGVRFLTAMPITILSVGQNVGLVSNPSQSSTGGGFQLENISFVDTSNNGSAIGGLLMNAVSEALIAYSSFENFNGQQAGLTTGTTSLSYGMKATAYGCVGTNPCSPLFNNNIVLLHVKGKNNSIFYDASQGTQDGPIVIGGDIFPTNNVSSKPSNPPWNGTNYAGCFGIISSGGIRLYGTHFDVGHDNTTPTALPCVGILTLSAGIISGKFESTPQSGTGVLLGGGGTSPATIATSPGCTKATNGAVSCTTTAAHGFAAGQVVGISFPNSSPTDQMNFNGNFLVTSVGSTTFTYDYPTGSMASSSSAGATATPKVSFSVKVEGIFNNLTNEVIVGSGASNNTIYDMSSVFRGTLGQNVIDNGLNDIVQLSNAGTGLNSASSNNGTNSTTVGLGAKTGASDAIVISDASGNTGTGHLVSVLASSGSTAKPVEFAANGNGVEMSTSGVLVPVGSGGLTVSGLTNATASDTVSNMNFPLTWNWAQTTNSQTAMSFGETSASTGTSDVLLGVTTQSGSTATPLNISQGSLTGSTAVSALNVTGTWNNASVSPNGVVFNFTNTASGSSTNILALQIASANRFRVDKNGNTVANGYISSTGVATAIATKASNYTLTSQDGTILCNGTITLTLPTTGIQTGQTYRIKFIASTGTCTVSSSVNIDGLTSFTITAQYNSKDVQWDGTQWWIVGANP